ncbi:hypothetical protein SKAU_G00171190 [Synaphobranchus kaupii]|uniref:Uncharacterized protein n=1 Tax=Synaphobranchus kaupii TaxID=118154 RepID=A0A9Q1FKX2_SYNKA|nr:hypothetical protein SKAU_G00171190 [Synaphobranchus kaupii]
MHEAPPSSAPLSLMADQGPDSKRFSETPHFKAICRVPPCGPVRHSKKEDARYKYSPYLQPEQGCPPPHLSLAAFVCRHTAAFTPAISAVKRLRRKEGKRVAL